MKNILLTLAMIVLAAQTSFADEGYATQVDGQHLASVQDTDFGIGPKNKCLELLEFSLSPVAYSAFQTNDYEKTLWASTCNSYFSGKNEAVVSIYHDMLRIVRNYVVENGGLKNVSSFQHFYDAYVMYNYHYYMKDRPGYVEEDFFLSY